jgi:hypothetical protein
MFRAAAFSTTAETEKIFASPLAEQVLIIF